MKPKDMAPRPAIIEVVGLVGRYACAILVALAVSAIITLAGVKAMDKGLVEFLSGAYNHPVHPIGSYCLAYTAAFAGVLLGSRCVPASSHSLAGAALLILGLAYYLTFWYGTWRHQMPSKHGNYP
jgi:hypothetical protein